MKKFLIMMIISSVMYSQGNESKSLIRTGFEIDALPYITGGYYFSAWGGYEKFRLRGVITNINSPDFIIPDGFEDLETDVVTVIVDYFPLAQKNEYEKWWVGVGLEYWKNSVVNSLDKSSAKYDNMIATLGGGYVWKIWGNLYLNPWAAVHLPITGTSSIKIGNSDYKLEKFLYEASLKLGWYF